MLLTTSSISLLCSSISSLSLYIFSNILRIVSCISIISQVFSAKLLIIQSKSMIRVNSYSESVTSSPDLPSEKYSSFSSTYSWYFGSNCCISYRAFSFFYFLIIFLSSLLPSLLNQVSPNYASTNSLDSCNVGGCLATDLSLRYSQRAVLSSSLGGLSKFIFLLNCLTLS